MQNERVALAICGCTLDSLGIASIRTRVKEGVPAVGQALLFDRHDVARRCRCGLPKGPIRNIHPDFEPDYSSRQRAQHLWLSDRERAESKA